MASILKVNTLTGVTAAGTIAVTAEGGTVTTNLQQGLAKVWMSFNGTSTVSTNDSFNTSALTDNGTGAYTVSIANDMANDDYVATFNASPTNERPRCNCCSDFATGSVAVTTGFPSDTSGGITNNDEVNCHFSAHGDLA